MKPNKPRGRRPPFYDSRPGDAPARPPKSGDTRGRGADDTRPREADDARPRKANDKPRNSSSARQRDEPPSRVARAVRERWTDSAKTAVQPPTKFRVDSEEAHATRDDRDEPARPPSVYGVRSVLEALRAGARPLERILISDSAHDSRLREITELARTGNVPTRRVSRAEVERVTGADANHQGVVALAAAARYLEADELIDRVTGGTPARTPLVVVLDGVEDPRNLGAIIRTAECAGAGGIFVPERRAAGLTETVAKTAAGALEYLPVARAANIVDLLARLKERGVWTIGTAADATTDYTEWDWRVPSALVLGGEGAGLRRLVRERCDALVRIPLSGHIESLNVSVAAGIVLYEAVRQRRGK